MRIFEHPELSLAKIGTLRTRKSTETFSSPLGVGFETLDREMFQPERCYDKVCSAGVKHARLQTGWNRCEKVKGVYDFAWLDASVDAMIERGINPWFNLGYGNPLYMKDTPHPASVGCIPHAYGKECIEAWLNFTAALTEHFKGRVSEYEIWNEPNIPCFWHPLRPSGKEYAYLVHYTAEVIRKHDPNAKTGGCTNGIACEFVLEALQNGIGKDIDFFCVHPYRIVPELNYANNVSTLKAIFKKYAPQVSLWQGECGYPSTAYRNSSAWMHLTNNSEAAQAHYVVRRIVLDSASGFERIQYFHTVDLIVGANVQADGKMRPPIMLGLLRGEDYSEKPAYNALQNLAAIFDGECRQADLLMNFSIPGYSEYVSGVSNLLMTSTHTFTRKGFPLYTWYLPESLQKEFPGLCGCKITTMFDSEKNLAHPVVVDPLSGNVYKATDVFFTDRKFHDRGEEADAIDFTGNAVVIRGLPLLDYPLILTDRDALDISC